jgi:hypothetical protein
MLGKRSKRSQNKLEESGTKATATIVEIAEKGIATSSGQEGIVANTQVVRKTRLRVTPENEPEFEVTQRFRFPQDAVPSAGRVISVIYDPADHDKIMLDQSREGHQKATLASDGFDPSSVSGEVEDLEMAELGLIEQGQTPNIPAEPGQDPTEQP